MQKVVQSLENYKQYSEHQYYWLDAIKAVSHVENCGGIGLEKGL